MGTGLRFWGSSSSPKLVTMQPDDRYTMIGRAACGRESTFLEDLPGTASRKRHSSAAFRLPPLGTHRADIDCETFLSAAYQAA